MSATDVTRRPGEYAAPLTTGITAGRLVFERGTAHDLIVVDHAMPELFIARFDRPVPRVENVGGTVRIRNPRARRHRGWIALNGRIPWAIELRGGVARVRAELGDADVSEFTVHGGASHVDLELSTPVRRVPIRFAGGVSAVTILRPRDVGARLVVQGGAAKVALDQQHFGAVGGPVDLRSHGYDEAEPRYDINVGGGAHAITIAGR